ncbi:MAG: hypothetical protein OXN17_17540 [Candidatus Poribacteria bacterium]|nr:hypothetical protein [Candidatus Poribacteria bacterium]MDE0503521.1 hypothetical protein [Candidatus Poribacteria bacterium]
MQIIREVKYAEGRESRSTTARNTAIKRVDIEQDLLSPWEFDGCAIGTFYYGTSTAFVLDATSMRGKGDLYGISIALV